MRSPAPDGPRPGRGRTARCAVAQSHGSAHVVHYRGRRRISGLVHQLRSRSSKGASEDEPPAGFASSPEGRIADPPGGTGIAKGGRADRGSAIRKGIQEGQRPAFRSAPSSRARAGFNGGLRMQPETLALDSKEIGKQFGFTYAIRNINLQVRRGEFVALFGSNGAGK